MFFFSNNFYTVKVLIMTVGMQPYEMGEKMACKKRRNTLSF